MSSAVGGFVVHRGDRGLQLVRAERRGRERVRDERDALVDAAPRSQRRAVLLGERDQRAVGAGARGAARVGEQHQREQAGDLAVVGQQAVHLPGEADRLGR